jgi:hypothetical protein
MGDTKILGGQVICAGSAPVQWVQKRGNRETQGNEDRSWTNSRGEQPEASFRLLQDSVIFQTSGETRCVLSSEPCHLALWRKKKSSQRKLTYTRDCTLRGVRHPTERRRAP